MTDDLRLEAMKMFDERFRIVLASAKGVAIRKNMQTHDLHDLQQHCLYAFWRDCLRSADPETQTTDIAIRFAVKKGMRSYLQHRNRKKDAMFQAYTETDLLDHKYVHFDGNGATPLEALAKPSERLPMGKWANALDRMPPDERERLRYLFTSGIGLEKAAKRLGVTRQSIHRSLRRDRTYGKRLGGYRFNYNRHFYSWRFPEDVSALPKGERT